MPSWKKVITSGSDAALNSLNVTSNFTASGLNYPDIDGTVGQVIITDGAGNLSFAPVENTAIVIKNVSGITITKGTPCYITGSGTSGNLAGVWPADAADPNRMPAGVIAGETLIAGAEGVGLINGYIGNVDTSTFAAGDSIYVKAGGGYTNIRPTGSAILVQKLGNVEKSSLNGSGVINGPAYYNDLPNVQSGYTWVGNANGIATAIATSSIQNVISSSFAATSSYVNTLNQSVIITGSAAIGTSSLGPYENTLTLGARDNTSEGGQIGFNAPGGSYTSASFIDNWQNKARILKGNNTTSTALIAQWDIHTTQLQLPAYTAASSFPGTATANLAVDSGGNVITVSTTGGTVFPYTGDAVITGSLTTTGIIYAQPNGGKYFQGGDDAALYDINLSNHIGIYGEQDSTIASIKLGSGGGIISGKSNNIGISTTNPTNGTLEVNGNVYATSFTGSLLGTAATASYYGGSVISASFASTSSYVNTLNQIVNIGTDIQLNDVVGIITANTYDAGLGTILIDGTVPGGLIDLNASTIIIEGDIGNITAATFTGTASYATQALSASYAPGVSKIIAGTNISISPTLGTGDVTINATAADPFPYTGSAIISGSLTVTGSLLITGSATLINQGPTILSGSFAVQGNGNGFTGPFTAITVDDVNFTRKLHDSQTGSGSLDFGTRDLLDGTGNGVFNWNGIAKTIDSRLYLNETISGATRNALITNIGYGGFALNDAEFDVSVQVNDLVFLDTDGIWYQVDQTTTSSTKMLGICQMYDPMSYMGTVILEGDIIVTTGAGYPQVQGANFGLPVYIREGNGTIMSTTSPTTDYVRLLGHCYHYDGGTEWIMKFKPSHDWTIL